MNLKTYKNYKEEKGFNSCIEETHTIKQIEVLEDGLYIEYYDGLSSNVCSIKIGFEETKYISDIIIVMDK